MNDAERHWAYRRGMGEKALRKKAEDERAATLPRVERDPCGFCGVRRDVGCRHFPRQHHQMAEAML